MTQAPVSLVIGGMTCGACAARVERCLNDLDGVAATVNYATERAKVALSEDVPLERLMAAVASAGYSAQPVDDQIGLPADTTDLDARVRSLGRRLVVSSVLFMPLCDLSVLFSVLPALRFPLWQWLLVVLAAPVVTWAAWPFYRAAVRGARHRMTTMDTLVSLGIVSSTGWSLYAMFARGAPPDRSGLFQLFHGSGGAIYLDVAAGVTTFLLAGRFFELFSKRRTGDALRSLAEVGAKDVAVLDRMGLERRIPISDLEVGTRFLVRPGETVAADGEVVFGRSALDRSAMTGESVPVDVGVGDRVVGGTVAVGGRIVVRATDVGADTQLAHMIRLVEDAQNEKAAVQRLADRISGVFVPAVLFAAGATLCGWLLTGGSTEHAFNAALSVLIVACPCALGLATPTALLVASGQGARLGIFFKGYQGLEVSRQVDTVVLDKTGTVTEGRMTVTDVRASLGCSADDVLRWAGSLEEASEHLVARAVAAAARRQFGLLPEVTQFVAITGLGAQGDVEGRAIAVGRRGLFTERGDRIPADLHALGEQGERAGQTTVFVGVDGTVVGVISLADTVRPSAAPAVQALEALGMHCVLLTGDNEATAQTVAAAVGITHVVAGALPAQKVEVIRQLQADGHSVAMIGDGVNDGPALATADLGLAVGSGTDVAINAADVIIVRDDLVVAATALRLARRTLQTIRGNLAWAFAYNLAAIPLAACGLLNPLIAGAAMAGSSTFVVFNSARLRHFAAVEGASPVDSPTASVFPVVAPGPGADGSGSDGEDQHVGHSDAHAQVTAQL